MTSDRRFEQDLPELMGQLAQGAMPDYRDHIVQQTARMRQRPAWTFPERWLPMTTATSRFAAIPGIPMKAVGLLALLLLALAIGAVLVAGAPARLPAPFGPAANGVVAYAAGGDIYTADPVSGAAKAVIAGPATDVDPVWSRDGSRFVFVREETGVPGAGRLHVALADGSKLTTITPEPFVNIHRYAFSPDGTSVVFLEEGTDGQRTMWTAKVDGSGAQPFEVGMEADWPSYRPGGAEILFAGQRSFGGLRNGIYAIDVKSGEVRTIVDPSAEPFLESLAWSPSGAEIAYVAWTPSGEGTCSKRIHVVTADGTADRTLPLPPGGSCDEPIAWSNDGTRLLVSRGAGGAEAALAIIPVDGNGLGLETDVLTSTQTLGGLSGEWAPDDTVILATPLDADGARLPQLLVDATTGAARPAPWGATSQPTWQRRAP